MGCSCIHALHFCKFFRLIYLSFILMQILLYIRLSWITWTCWIKGRSRFWRNTRTFWNSRTTRRTRLCRGARIGWITRFIRNERWKGRIRISCRPRTKGRQRTTRYVQSIMGLVHPCVSYRFVPVCLNSSCVHHWIIVLLFESCSFFGLQGSLVLFCCQASLSRHIPFPAVSTVPWLR